MKTKLFIALFFSVIVSAFSTSAFAFDVWVNGKPSIVYADPSDVVVVLSNAGPCGSKFFHIQRAKVNFKELTSLAENALLYNKSLAFDVTDCSGDRNILSHGAIY